MYITCWEFFLFSFPMQPPTEDVLIYENAEGGWMEELRLNSYTLDNKVLKKNRLKKGKNLYFIDIDINVDIDI